MSQIGKPLEEPEYVAGLVKEIKRLTTALAQIAYLDCYGQLCAKTARQALGIQPDETTEHPCSFPGCIRDDEDHARHTAETTAVRTDSERLRWLANTVLACDYGDNHHPAKLVGWRVLEFISPVMYGASIAEAIDAAMAQEKPKRQPKETKLKHATDCNSLLGAKCDCGADPFPQHIYRDAERTQHVEWCPACKVTT